jgi:type III secretion system YscQ/HrcQ family protein
VDRLLGGRGEPPPDLRPPTEVEAGLLTYVLLRVLRGLHEMAGVEPGSLLRLAGILGEGRGSGLPEDGPCLVLALRLVSSEWQGEVRAVLPERAVELLGKPGEPAEPAAAVQDIPLLLRAEVGETELTPGDLASLEPGDVLVPERLHVAPREDALVGGCVLRFGTGGRGGVRAAIRIDEDAVRAEVRDFVVDGFPERGATEETAMDENEQLPEMEPQEPEVLEEGEPEEAPPLEPMPLPEGTGGDAGDMVREIPLTVSIEMGRLRLSVGEVSALKPGQVLDLRRSPQSPVDLVVGGRIVAQGDLIEIQGELGVRISGIVR